MKLGLSLGYWERGYVDPTDVVAEAERLGYDSLWTAEAYGSDAVSTLAWAGSRTSRMRLGTAIMQIPSRSPALAAMTAATLDQLSGGRFILGLGMSGPQVVEGWHGVPYGRPLTRTREYVSIVREILRREKPLTFEGEHYRIPIPDGTGLGKPLRITVHPLRAHLPIFLAAEGPKNVALAAEIADGWLPLFFAPEHAGFYAEALSSARPGFEIAATVPVVVGDDLSSSLDVIRPFVALYAGGMGARGRNFHYDLFVRYGFEEPARRIQDAYLGGRVPEAVASVPDEMADAVSLCGPPERIKERVGLWRDAGVTTLIVGSRDPAVLRLLAEATL